MVTFSRDKKKGRTRRILFSFLGTLFFVLILFPLLFNSVAIHSGLFFWRTGTRLGDFISSSLVFFQRNESLRLENQSLKEEIEALRMQNQSSVDVDQIPLDEETKMLLPVIAKPFKTGSDTIILEHENTPEIQKYIGMVVTTKEGIPVGVVEKTTTRLVYVKLFSFSGNRIVLRETKENIDFELVGRSSGNFHFEANQDVPVSVGGFLYLPGFDTFPVAQIAKVVSRQHDPEKIYLATLVINYNNLNSLVLTEKTYGFSD